MSLRPVRSRRHRFSYRQRASLNSQWQSHWNYHIPRNPLEWFGSKKFVLGIVLLASVLGGTVLAQGPLFHSYSLYSQQPTFQTITQNGNVRETESNTTDPFTTLWDGGITSGDLSEYNSFASSYQTGPVIRLAPNGLLGSAVAISKARIDLSLGSAKELTFAEQWTKSNGLPPAGEWGWFLTQNSTAPSQYASTAYLPYTDRNVAVEVVNYIGAFESPACPVNKICSMGLLQHDSASSIQSSGLTRSQFITDFTGHTISNTNGNFTIDDLTLNYTGHAANGGQNGVSQLCFGSNGTHGLTCPVGGYGDGIIIDLMDSNGGIFKNTLFPWLSLTIPYYLGFFASGIITGYTIDWSVQSGGVFATNFIDYYVPAPPTPVAPPSTVDTGGFFGPVIRALISIGVFIFSNIFNFFAYLASILGPVLSATLEVLEGFLTAVLNTIGNLLWPNSNLGTLLAGFLNAIIQLFTNTSYGLPAFFANFPSYFTNFLAWLQITFPFLAPMFSIANAILGFAVSVVPTGVTIMTLGLQMFLFGYATLILASFFIYTGDDGIGGFLTFLGKLEALSFKILNIIATLTNLGLDILVIIVSLIPKPLIQMSASKLPRLPTLETGATMAFPVMDLGEARNGNMVVYWLWSMGLYMFAWFESRNPSLPGSLGAMYAPLATNMGILSVYLPLLQAMVLISGGLLLAWTAMMPLRTIGFDIMGLSPFGVSLGRRTGAGPSTVKLR